MPKLAGKANYQNYDAHFVPVVPDSPDDPSATIYFPSKPNQKPQYHEMVVFDPAQCIPRYVVELQPSLPKAPSLGLSLPSFTSSVPVKNPYTILPPPVESKLPVEETKSPKVPAKTSPSSTSSVWSSSPSSLPKPSSSSSLSNSMGLVSSPAPLSSTLLLPPGMSISSSSSSSSSLILPIPAKVVVAKPVDMKVLGEVLQHVARGEQKEAETLVSRDPGLLLAKGTVVDLSKRTFNGITAFQYAVWAGDWRMYRMLLKYLPKDQAALQLVELETRGTAHGKHFSLAPLIEALRTYAKNYAAWPADQCKQHWCKVVGGSQLLLPAHVVNAYCHPSLAFHPCPGFGEEELPRSMKLYGDQGSWFTAEYGGGKLGETFGVVRSSLEGAWRDRSDDKDYYGGGSSQWVRHDAEALQSLSKMCQLQLDKLESELTLPNSLTFGKK